ncbi:D-isomer specific 2-hydroxyacid dehydrogenase [Lipomyces chichibuensis]|uniref:D-isomer specific 2-hydroxyacid dehydrogenase n=1 Tax=Lipomyces chichibuensis TaxID=1546026 RepID=UPI003343BAEE
MTLKLAILDDYQSVALKIADWTPVIDAGVDITVFNDTIQDEDALVARLEPFTILCIMRERTPFSESLFRRLPNLKLLVTTGMRNLAVNIEAATNLGITVVGTQSPGWSTTEHIWALILGIARNIVPDATRTATPNVSVPWQAGRLATGLYGKTIGLIGLGRLGVSVAKIAQAFGMRVTAWSQNLTLEKAAEVGVEFAGSKEELLRNSDFVSLHVVLSPRTVDLISETELKLMKKTAFLINTSRGPIVNEKALVAALRNGTIAGAALDVYEVEPLPPNNELRTLGDRVLITPHSAYVTDDTYKTYFEETVEDVVQWLAGEPVRVIN